MAEPQLKPHEVKIRVHDGVDIAVALYMPDGDGRFPVVLGASPYRYDNNALPATPQFLWRETGPIQWYVERGYAYVHADVRGSGRSRSWRSARPVRTLLHHHAAGNADAEHIHPPLVEIEQMRIEQRGDDILHHHQ